MSNMFTFVMLGVKISCCYSNDALYYHPRREIQVFFGKGVLLFNIAIWFKSLTLRTGVICCVRNWLPTAPKLTVIVVLSENYKPIEKQFTSSPSMKWPKNL